MRPIQRRKLLKAAALAPILAQPTLASAIAQQDGTEIRTPVPLSKRMADAILPANRILSYYGFPTNELMGILGEYDPPTLLGLLQEQAAAFEAIDSTRPLKLAFEIIASVAQRDAMADGSYLSYTARDFIDQYVEFTRDNDLLLLLDMQFGRRTVQDEINAVLEWLAEPHVHLALDPEFSVEEGEVPGEVLGSIDATDVTFAQEFLADFALERGLPPKILVVHQFNLFSISNREQIKPVDGVQFVLEVDGWGPPDMKRDTYEIVVGPDPIEYYGFKLWYQQDEPLMTEADVLALSPSPDLVIYQ
jgi:hypothetical protein